MSKIWKIGHNEFWVIIAMTIFGACGREGALLTDDNSTRADAAREGGRPDRLLCADGAYQRLLGGLQTPDFAPTWLPDARTMEASDIPFTVQFVDLIYDVPHTLPGAVDAALAGTHLRRQCERAARERFDGLRQPEWTDSSLTIGPQADLELLTAPSPRRNGATTISYPLYRRRCRFVIHRVPMVRWAGSFACLVKSWRAPAAGGAQIWSRASPLRGAG